MKKTALAAGVVALALAAPALGAPPNSSSVTLTAAGNPIVIGSSSTLSGVVTGKHAAGASVTLQSKAAPYTGPFANVATATADSTGHYTFKVTPKLNTDYDVVAKAAPSATSPQVTVKVAVKVTEHLSTTTPAAGHSVRFSGYVLPAYNGKFVSIQRKTATGYKTVARAKLRAATPAGTITRSKYSKSVVIRHSGQYRVSFNPADGLRLAGSARTRKVTVH